MKGGCSMECLVIDDEVELRDTVVEILEMLGHKAMAVGSGKEGVSLVQNDPGFFDVIFTDRSMPGMLGEEVVHEVKKLAPKIFVALMSADEENMVRVVGLAAGADAILHKPFGIAQLQEALAQAAAR